MDTGNECGRQSARGSAWTQDEVRTLSELWEREVPVQAIADLLGRTHRSVSVKATRLGLKSRVNAAERNRLMKIPTAGMRKCLNCQKLFFSEGKGNRICHYCKSSTGWDSGNDYVLDQHARNLGW